MRNDEDDEVSKVHAMNDRLEKAADKSQNGRDYQGIVSALKWKSTMARSLALQLVPRYFKFFPDFTPEAIKLMFDLLEDDELMIRVYAIRGLPILCEDNSANISKIAKRIAGHLISGKTMECVAVRQSLNNLMEFHVKDALSSLIKYFDISNSEPIRKAVLSYLKSQVLPRKAVLLNLTEDMEKFITNVVTTLKDLTQDEFDFLIDLLNNFKMFGEGAHTDQLQVLVDIIERHADLSQMNLLDDFCLDRFFHCVSMALPFLMRGTSSVNFMGVFKQMILSAFAESPERKLNLLKNFAEISPYATNEDSEVLLRAVVDLLKYHLLQSENNDTNICCVECLIFAFHHLAYKIPGTATMLCGLCSTGEKGHYTWNELSTDFIRRLNANDNAVRAAYAKLLDRRAEYEMQICTGVTENEKADIEIELRKIASLLVVFNNVLTLAQPLYSRSFEFRNYDMKLSWRMEASNNAATRRNT